MRTANEFRCQAKDCLELANRTDEYYAKVTLKELARKLHREARQADRRERDMARFSDIDARRSSVRTKGPAAGGAGLEGGKLGYFR